MVKSTLISPKLRKVIGSVKLPKDFDEEKELRKALEKKYRLKKMEKSNK